MFNETARGLMAAMFEGGLATEIAGVYTDRLGDEHRWEVRYYPAGRYNVDAFFTGTVANYYDMYEGDTLDEVLDLLDAWVALDTKEAVPA